MADGLSLSTDGLWTHEVSLNIKMATEIDSDIEMPVQIMDYDIAPEV